LSEGTNYEALLTELVEERANLDRMIAWVQRRLDKGELSVSPPQQPSTGILRFPRLRPDQFFKMSVPEAIRAFLNIMKRPQSARDITDALQAGGLSHRAQDLYQTVFPTLQRMKGKGEVDKLANGEWGLAEWYTAGRRTEAESGNREPDK
jgi:hypothetical protein